jgi:hypothetical protein
VKSRIIFTYSSIVAVAQLTNRRSAVPCVAQCVGAFRAPLISVLSPQCCVTGICNPAPAIQGAQLRLLEESASRLGLRKWPYIPAIWERSATLRVSPLCRTRAGVVTTRTKARAGSRTDAAPSGPRGGQGRPTRGTSGHPAARNNDPSALAPWGSASPAGWSSSFLSDRPASPPAELTRFAVYASSPSQRSAICLVVSLLFDCCEFMALAATRWCWRDVPDPCSHPGADHGLGSTLLLAMGAGSFDSVDWRHREGGGGNSPRSSLP